MSRFDEDWSIEQRNITDFDDTDGDFNIPRTYKSTSYWLLISKSLFLDSEFEKG